MNTNHSTVNTLSYPASVYKLIDEKFSAKTAEAIASQKPYWAEFDCTDIGTLTMGGDVGVTWCAAQGYHSNIAQETTYSLAGELIESKDPSIQIWAGDPGYVGVDEAENIAVELVRLANELKVITLKNAGHEVIVTSKIRCFRTEFTLFHMGECRVKKGDESYETYFTPAYDRDRAEAHSFDTMTPGESFTFSIGRGYPKEHFTYRGAWILSHRLPDGTAVLYSNPAAHYLASRPE